MTSLNNSSLLGAQFVTIVDLSNVINVNDANKDSFEITYTKIILNFIWVIQMFTRVNKFVAIQDDLLTYWYTPQRCVLSVFFPVDFLLS